MQDLINRISGAQAGDVITIGPFEFVRQHSTVGGQVKLFQVLIGTLAKGDALTAADALLHHFGNLIDAALVVLRDYDPTFEDDQLLSLRGDQFSLVDLLDLVLGQVVVDQNGPVLEALGSLGTAMALSQVIGRQEVAA